jgi:hypothetical protein
MRVVVKELAGVLTIRVFYSTAGWTEGRKEGNILCDVLYVSLFVYFRFVLVISLLTFGRLALYELFFLGRCAGGSNVTDRENSKLFEGTKFCHSSLLFLPRHHLRGGNAWSCCWLLGHE